MTEQIKIEKKETSEYYVYDVSDNKKQLLAVFPSIGEAEFYADIKSGKFKKKAKETNINF